MPRIFLIFSEKEVQRKHEIVGVTNLRNASACADVERVTLLRFAAGGQAGIKLFWSEIPESNWRLNLGPFFAFALERVRGVEPLPQPWEGCILPLNYTRKCYEGWGRRSRTATVLISLIGRACPSEANRRRRVLPLNYTRAKGFALQFQIINLQFEFKSRISKFKLFAFTRCEF